MMAGVFGSLLLACLLVTSLGASIEMSDSSTETVANPAVDSGLSASYTLASGYTWNRAKSGGYNLYSEIYSLSGHASCTIQCPPYAYPVQSGGVLYCQRDSTFYSGLTNTNNAAFKSLCIPEVLYNDAACLLATYFIYNYPSGGHCNYNVSSGNPYYSGNSANFDCCMNNYNSAVSQVINAYTDNGAIIL